MLKPGSLLDLKWYQSPAGMEIMSSLQRGDMSHKTFGLLEHPHLPPMVTAEEVQYKIMLVGKNGVGKTATAANLTGYSPMENYYETPGIQVWQTYWPARIRQLNKVMLFHLCLWESGTTAMRKFDHILPALKENVDCILLVFSLLDKSSFDELPHLISRLTEPNDNICKIAIGTKFDQFDQSEITQSDMQAFEQQWHIPIFKLQNLSNSGRQGAESPPRCDTILSMICEQLWAKDLKSVNTVASTKLSKMSEEIVF